MSDIETKVVRQRSGGLKRMAPPKRKRVELIEGDCLEGMAELRPGSVDLVFGSPPYSNQRRYGSKVKLFRDDEDWAEWAVIRFIECLRISRGLVAWVVEGYTSGGTFHPLPELLTIRLFEKGVNIRRRAIYHRMGTPGGSPDELAQHHEIVVMASSDPGRLPYADPCATGHAPKYKPGGAPTHRTKLDTRVSTTMRQARGGSEKKVMKTYKPPKICKASNVITCGAVGGGNMGPGGDLATLNEAPFCYEVARKIVLTYCPPGGVVLDPFCGSSTTGHVALDHGRRFVGIDKRASQIELSEQRLRGIK